MFTKRFVAGAAATIAALVVAFVLITVASGQSPLSLGREPNDGEQAGDIPPDALGREFQEYSSVGFDKADEGAATAVSLAPFPARLPEYIPAGLRPWNVSLYIDVESGKGNLGVYWTTPPRADGSPLPGLFVEWTDGQGPEGVEAQLPPVVEDGTIEIGGLSWRWYLIKWRDFDMYQARTYTVDGVLISSDIRVIDMDHTTAFAELQKVLADVVGSPASP